MENDGNLTITDIKVTDELTGDEWTIASLAPGESEEFTASYTVTEDDILAGKVVNVATATGTSPDPDEPDVPVEPGEDPEPTLKPHLSVFKAVANTPANGSSFAKGEVILYSITVVNDGGIVVKGITVKDSLTGDIWKVDSLKPGESQSFFATYTVGDYDVTVGQVVNTATPTTDTPGVPTTPGSTVTRTGKYVVPLGIGASAQCGDCFE